MPEDSSRGHAWSLGIDFGTTNTAAAFASRDSDTTHVFRLGDDQPSLSSSVFVESPDQIDVGAAAIDKAQRNPYGFLAVPKNTVSSGTANVNGYDIPASVAIGAVLDSIVRRAVDANGGRAPTELVLTHPEWWSEREVEVLVDAARRLELSSTRILTESEPRSAAMYYSHSTSLRSGAKIAVFDFGGGTLDIAVLELGADGSFTVLSSDGAPNLGGRTLDSMIRSWVDHQLELNYPGAVEYLRSAATAEQIFQLENSIRRAKELLSQTRTATISVPNPGQQQIQLDMSRQQLEQITRPALDDAVAITQRTLSAGGIQSPYDLEALYLTGGSSRIPLVHELLSPLGPVSTLDDPKTIVAQGALSAAGNIARSLAVTSPAPAQDSQSSSARAATAVGSGTRTRRRGLLFAVSAVIAVLVIGAGGFALTRNSAPDPAPVSEAPAAPVLPATDPETLLASLPTELADGLSDCKAFGDTDYGGIEFQCHLDADSESAKGNVRFNTTTMFIAADEDAAGVELAKIRAGYKSSPGAEVEVVEDPQRVSAAAISSGEGTGTTLEFASEETHISLRSFDFKSPDTAKDFLRKSGLMAEIG